jgi:hypothetical protein
MGYSFKGVNTLIQAIRFYQVQAPRGHQRVAAPAHHQYTESLILRNC